MSLSSVRQYLAQHAPDIQIVELQSQSSTFTLSADWGILPAQIAKSLLLTAGERTVMLVTCGDARIDNKKAKAVFSGKVSMVPAAHAEEITGHPVGGICPLGLVRPMAVYCDVGLKAFAEVVPGAGSTHHAFRIDPERLAQLSGAQWIDVCQAR